MRHRRRVKHFGRKSGPRKALFRGLVRALVEHGRIQTTLEKAKELRRHVEPLITLGKKVALGQKGDLATRRLLLEKIPSRETVAKILDEISPRFQKRPGGYTRLIKLGQRQGDRAEMAFIEFVDYNFKVNGASQLSTGKKLKKKESEVNKGKVAKEEDREGQEIGKGKESKDVNKDSSGVAGVQKIGKERKDALQVQRIRERLQKRKKRNVRKIQKHSRAASRYAHP